MPKLQDTRGSQKNADIKHHQPIGKRRKEARLTYVHCIKRLEAISMNSSPAVSGSSVG
jgi:hypothetical protein